MNNINKIVISIAFTILIAISGWALLNGNTKKTPQSASLLTEEILGDGTLAILPIPSDINLNPDKVALGRDLFADSRLSGNGFSCATCHPLDNAGMDGLKLSITTGGGFDVKNTPTIFNTGFNAMQLWNGKKDSLENQIDEVINNPQHMDSSWPLIISRLQKDDDYRRRFNSIYTDGLNPGNIKDAIATYERSLFTPDSDFDLYLRGDFYAITPEQKKGFELFKNYGCISCHQGINVGGNLFAQFGIFENQLTRKKNLTEYDYGRYLYTRNNQDKFIFRVPSLRNVAHTAPYFHDGSAETLSDAIKIMASFQLDIELPEKDIEHIELFLHSLNGKYQGKKL